MRIRIHFNGKADLSKQAITQLKNWIENNFPNKEDYDIQIKILKSITTEIEDGDYK